ncbi:benzoate transporter BenE [Pseudoalteromonas phenolica O-BC30]|uniref:Benzoate transporter n=2 Tax=Pseudoalteromonas phenolica TaxID=161398 RepID=A0A0S2K2A3_9GAMM|nr:Benzoate transporter [Pseudoalteromonas phenolica]MBE0356576.1 benzoate membrane transport protein [Pseudoalteromonas phenolica O-BC30]RXE96977.1 benzoate transporter BenE [Pseudoalteromonas phenolica O-BC30]
MLKSVTMGHLSAGFTAVMIGYASAAVIVIQAASALGASEAQIESWLMTLGLIMGLSSIGLSWWFKTPILTAWSTPSAVLLVGVGSQYDIHTAIAAFMLVGIATILTGYIKPLCKAVENIPSPLASAMLAAILLPFCLTAFEVVEVAPSYFALLFCCFCLAKLWLPKLTMFILLGGSLVLAIVVGAFDQTDFSISFGAFEFMPPNLDASNLTAILNLAVPLYLVTMLSQNLPGLALLQTYGYRSPTKSALVTTGALNFLTAPFGGFSLNLAAISAAVCMNEDVDTSKTQRYKAAMCAGVFYLIAGLFASSVVSLFLALPKSITSILAGFALLGTLLLCLQNAFSDPKSRDAALLTLLISFSGVSLFGINSIMLGLMVGLIYSNLQKHRLKPELKTEGSEKLG